MVSATKKDNPVITDKNQLPLTMETEHLQSLLGLGRKKIYEYLNEVERMQKPPFPVKRIGRSFKVPRDPFFLWFENIKVI